MKAESAGIQEVAGADFPGAEDGAEGVFFCVAVTSRGSKKKISYFHTNARGEEAEAARALTALCLDHAPEHHRWHHHTVAGARTFAFLSAVDGRTYFAAAGPTPGGVEMVRLLERVRDACDGAPRKRLRGEAVDHVARHFAQALRAVASGSSTVADVALPRDSPRVRLPSTPMAPVCAAGAGVGKDEETLPVGAQVRAVQPGESAQARRPPTSWRRTWWRHAVVAIAVDVVVCLVLFAVWMGVCKGFRCLAR